MVCVSTRKVTKSSKSPKRRLIEKNLVTGKISSNFFSVLKRRKKKITGPCVSTIIKKQTVICYILWTTLSYLVSSLLCGTLLSDVSLVKSNPVVCKFSRKHFHRFSFFNFTSKKNRRVSSFRF